MITNSIWHMKQLVLQNLLFKLLKICFLCGLGILNSQSLSAQVVTSGTDFWFTLLENFNRTNANGLRVYISTTVGATGTVSVPGCGFSQNFACPPNGGIFVDLPQCAEPTGSGVIQNKAIRVVSNNPVSVYSVNSLSSTTDGSMIMPINTLGYDYYVMSFKNRIGFYSGETEFSFCAINPNTQIEFTPTVNTVNGFPANVPQIVTLNPGQMMQVKASGDLTGSRVRVIGNNCLFPIAVFSGNVCTTVGSCTACDHLYEMLSPNTSLGRQFVYVPTRRGLTFDVLRIMAVQNGTNVTVAGVAQPVMNAGQFITIDANTINATSAMITSNNPIAVAVFAKGGECRGGDPAGDPMMMMLTPVDILGVTAVNMSTVDLNGMVNTHYINLVTASANTGNITVTPPPINCEGWTTVPGNPALSTRRCEINAGSFNVTSTGSGFNIFQYGWGERDSYGMAGAGIVNQNPINMGGAITFQDSVCANRAKLFTALSNTPPLQLTWDWGDGSPIEVGPGISRTHTYTGCGVFTIRVEYSTQNGTFCAERRVNVWATPNAFIETRPPQIVCSGQTANFAFRIDNTCNGRLPWGNQPNVVPFNLHYTINGVPQTPVTVNRNQSVTLTTPPVTECLTYRLTSVVNNYQPWTGQRCETLLDESFTICPAPPLPLQAVANPATICIGQQTTLTASGAVNYTWNPGNMTGNPIVVSPNTTTTYTVIGSDNNNCTGSATVTVTVQNPSPPTVTPQNAFYCLGQSPSAHTATSPNGGTFNWYTVPNGGIPIFTGATFNVPTNTAGNFNYFVENVANGCTSARTLVQVTVQRLPQPAVTPSDTIYCLNAAPSNHTAFSNNGGTFAWYTVPNGGMPIFTGATFTVPTNVAGVFFYYVENIVGTCTSGRRPLRIEVREIPAPTVSPAQATYCLNQNPSAHTVTFPNIGTFHWYTVPNGGTPIFTGTTYNVPTHTAGNFTYYVESVVNACTSNRAEVRVQVDALPIAGTISGVNTVCSGNNTTLTLTGYSSQVVRWEFSTDNFITFTTVNNTTDTYVTGNLTQNTCFRAWVRNGICNERVTNPYCVQTDQRPVAGQLSRTDTTVCSGNPIGNVTLSGSWGNIIWERSNDCPGFGTFTTINNTTTTLSVGVITQTTCFRARVSNGVCPSVVSELFTARVFNNTPGTITANQTICIGTDPNPLRLINYTGNIIRWESSINGFGTFTTINNQTDTHAPTGLTTLTCFRAQVSENNCTAYSTPACIQVDALTIGGSILSDQTVCQGSFVNSLTLQNRRGTVLWWESSPDNFATVSTIPNSAGQPVIQPGVVNQTTCYRAVVQNGMCPQAFSAPACITTVPLSNGGTLNGNRTVCTGNSTNLDLTGNVGNIIQWEVSTAVNFPLNATTIINHTNNSFTTPVLTGNVFYRVLVQNAPCNSVYSNTVSITVTDFPDRGVLTSAQTVCSDVVPTTLTLSGYVGTIVRWESSSDHFISNTVTINHTNDTYNTGLLNQTTSYRTVVNSPNCGIVYSDPIRITVLPTTVPGMLPANQTVCSGSTGTLTLTGYTGNIVRWELSYNNFATFSVINNTTPTLTYNNILQSVSYRVLVQSPGCPARYSTVTRLTVVRAPIGGTLYFNQTVCPNSVPKILFLSGWSGTITRWESSTDNFATVQTILNTTSRYQPQALTQTTQYRVVVETGCAPAYSSVVTITVPPYNPGTIASDMTFCTNPANGTLTLSNFAGNVVAWEGSTDNFVTVQPFGIQQPTFDFQNVTTTTQYRARINSGGCMYYSPVATITVLRESMAGFVIPNQAICSGTIPQQFVLLGASGNVIRWESSTDDFATVNTIANTNTFYRSGALSQTTKFRAVVQIPGCNEFFADPVTVTVYQTNGGTVSTDQTICSGNIPNPLTLTGNGGNIVRWESSTDGFASYTAIGNTTNTLVLPALSQTTAFRVVSSDKICGSSNGYSNVVTITVLPAPEGGYLSADQSICAGNVPNPLTLTAYSGNILRWESSTDNFVLNVMLIGNVNDTYAPPALTQTTYYRAVVGQNGCAEAFSNSVGITVNPAPVGGTLLSDQTLCIGNSAKPLTLTQYEGNILHWESSTDGFMTVTTINNTIASYNPGMITQTTEYRVLIGRSGCTPVYSTIAKITVANGGLVGGTLSSNMTVCEGSTTDYTLTLSGYSGPILRWESSNNNFHTFRTIANTSASHIFNRLTETTKFRVAIGTEECGLVYSSEVQVSVVSIVEAGTIIVTPDQTISCEVNNGNLKLVNYDGTIVHWESSTDGFQTATIIPNSSNIIPYSITGSTQFRVLINHPSCGLMYSQAVSVSPGLRLTATAYKECNATGKIVVTATGGRPPYSFSISPNAGLQTQIGVFTGLPLGTYTITVKDQLGCIGTITSSIPTTVSAPRVTNIVLSGNTGARITWDIVQPGGANVVYQLQYRKVGSPAWTGPLTTNGNVYTISGLTSATAYEVQVRVRCVASNELSDWSASTYFNTIARIGTENFADNEMLIYPNPNNGSFIVRLPEGIITAELSISDLSGKLIYFAKQTDNEQQHYTKNIASGVYLLQIKYEGQVLTSKLVIE